MSRSAWTERRSRRDGPQAKAVYSSSLLTRKVFLSKFSPSKRFRRQSCLPHQSSRATNSGRTTAARSFAACAHFANTLAPTAFRQADCSHGSGLFWCKEDDSLPGRTSYSPRHPDPLPWAWIRRSIFFGPHHHHHVHSNDRRGGYEARLQSEAAGPRSAGPCQHWRLRVRRAARNAVASRY